MDIAWNEAGSEPGWITAILAFAAVLFCAFTGQFILGRIVAKAAYRWPPSFQAVFGRTRRLAHVAFVLLAVAVALPLAPLTASATEGIQKALSAAFIGLLGWMLIIAVAIGAERALKRLDFTIADNLEARTAATQIHILTRIASGAIVVLTIALVLMSFESVRQYGFSLFASAGVVGIIIGLAAQSTIGNLLAGVQLAMTQPIRLDDVLVVEGEFGNVEEINSTYVVIRLWDWRRLVVPLKYFLEQPFQNWTRTSASVIGAVTLHLDYVAPIETIRMRLAEIASESPLWDRQVVDLQVTGCMETAVELRALVSASNASRAWDLRCHVREQLLAFVQETYPEALPRRRNENAADLGSQRAPEPYVAPRRASAPR